MSIRSRLTALALFMAAACHKSAPEHALPRASGSAPPAASAVPSSPPSAQPSASVAPVPRASRRRPSPGKVDVLESEKAFLVSKTNQFGVSLYQKLAAKPGNILFSPLGVASALALLDAGARGRTAQQIETGFGWKLPGERVRATYASLLVGAERGGFVDACRLVGPGRFSDQFRQEVEQRFGAAVETGPVSTLAGWLGEHGVADARFRPPSAGFVLAEVSSVRSGWRWPFAPERTQPEPFRGQPAVATMRQILTVPVGQVGEVTLVELPYRDPGFALDLLVPEAGAGLGALEKALSTEYLESLFAATKLETVELGLPRFTLSAEPDLGRELGALGLPGLFGATADWSGVGKGTRLGALLHYARISVDEGGSEAASRAGARPPAGQASRKLSVDRPFVLVVRDVLGGTVLLMGRVVAPAAAGSGR